MLDLFDRYYSRVICWGLLAAVWFAALFQAAHDVWSASVLFVEVTLLGVIFCIGRSRDKKPIQLPLLLPFTFLLLALRASFWRAYDVDTAWLEFWGWTFGVVMFYLFINVVDTDEKIDGFFSRAGLIVIPILLHCLWQRISPPPPVDGIPPTVGLFGYGFFKIPLSSWITRGHPWIIRYGLWEIHAALINSVVMAGFVLYWTLFSWKKMIQDRRYAVVFIAAIGVLVFARSWWAFLTLLLGYLFYYRQKLRETARAHQKIAGLAFFALVAGVFLILYIKTHHGVERAVDASRYHANSRLYYWGAAWAMLKSNPLTGVGLGGFATAYPHFKIGQTENTLFAHGLLFQFLSETGMLGVLAWLGVGVAYLRIRFKQTQEKTGFTASVFDATLITILSFSLISINMDFLLNQFTFFLVVGATLTRRPVPAYRTRPIWMILSGCCLVLLSALWLNLYVASRLYTAGLYWEKQGEIQKAMGLYQEAIQVEPSHADSYWRLALIHQTAYQATHAPDEWTALQVCLRQTLRYKKDLRFSNLLNTLSAGS